MKKIFLILIMPLFLFGCTKDNPALPNESAESSVPAKTEMALGQQPELNNNDKLCGWIDESDIIIKVNFAEGVTKDSSYEVGFYFSSILSTMRVARAGCDYRVGFKYSELKTTGAGRVGAAEVGVRGYSDSVRRHIQNEPISLTLDDNGVPPIGSRIEVTITD